jgi:hypothetical protein
MQPEKPEKGKDRYNDHDDNNRAEQSDSSRFITSQ